MKLLLSAVSSAALAWDTTFRAGTFQISQLGNNEMQITTTMAWEIQYGDTATGYWGPGCSADTIANEISSSSFWQAPCTLLSTGGTCPQFNIQYTATSNANSLCYGDDVQVMTVPAGPFQFDLPGSSWRYWGVQMTNDAGQLNYINTAGNQNLVQTITINDANNNTPRVKLPSHWLIMAGCVQKIELQPYDIDGDYLKCRWATVEEAGGAWNDGVGYPSLSLDEENCIVYYDGSNDATVTGLKPIGLMIEDFDANGAVKSTVPVQFLAHVWTPNLNSRSLGTSNYPKWYPKPGKHTADMHDDDERELKNRGRRAAPSYCGAVPVWVGDTPASGITFDATSGEVVIELEAESANGDIVSITISAPVGLKCAAVVDGKSECTWSMTEEQKDMANHQFCYEAVDVLGLVSERRCIFIASSAEQITTKAPPTGQPSTAITNILEMAAATLDGENGSFVDVDGVDYGCAGRGAYDAFSRTAGKQVDEADKAFYAWKKCVQCAVPNAAAVAPYDYDADSDSCAGSASLESRAVCECDRQLCAQLRSLVPQYSNYNDRQCEPGTQTTIDCCNWDTYRYAVFNPRVSCCSRDGVKDIGTC